MSRLARRPLLRAFSSSDQQLRAQLVGDRNVDIFDRDVKRKQRDRAAWLMKADDQLLSKATEGLLDRLDDCKRKFPTALNLGGAFEHVRRLLHGRGGVETLINMDISTDMIEKSRQNVATEISVNVGSPAITNVHMVGDEEFLPLEERSLDLVVSSLGLHWVNDLPGAIIQCRNALKPDGLFLASIFGGESLSELRIACTCAQLEREGGVSPRISPLAQMRDAGNLLTRAGLALSEVDVDTFTVRYPSALELIDNLREMGETNAVRQRNQVLRRDTALAAAAIYEAMFAAEDGSVPATFQVLYLTGWSPHASQQTPKRRGSATVSFQDLQKALDEKPAEASSRKPGEEQPKAQPPASKDAEETVHLPSGTWYTLK